MAGRMSKRAFVAMFTEEMTKRNFKVRTSSLMPEIPNLNL
jgi:hypothetical protein